MNKKKNRKYSFLLKSETKNIIIACLFITIGSISIFSELNSTAGYYANKILNTLFGNYYKFIFSPIILILGILIFFKEGFGFNISRMFGIILYFISLNTIIGYLNKEYVSFFNLNSLFLSFFGANVSIIFMILLFLFSLFLIFRINFKQIIKKIISYTPNLVSIKDDIYTQKKDLDKKFVETKKSFLYEEKQSNLQDKPIKIDIIKKESSISSKIDNSFSSFSNEKEESKIQNNFKEQNYNKWKLPSLDLLSDIGGNIKIDENFIYKKQKEIIDKLAQFKINVNITGYRVGPTIIQFRLKPEEGIKLNKIENLKKDLTLALHAKSIRIQAPIPGEGVVGIEVPNSDRQVVGLKEVIEAYDFNNPKYEIPIAIGKDVNGDIIIGDLTKMPHLLVAGQTASGKSVGMNGFIISMLYKFSPSELKMIMIDPKRVELSLYNGIPHLLTQVITSPDKALNSLKWAVAEMLRRYDLATKINVRNFKEYNNKVEKEEKLPYIVIIIDELADLMMSGNKKEVENSIARISQMARAVGMHLIVATQRPSVDVITGLIKANIPSRIAFTVASQIDSRTVIDKAGAEDLLGRGDMLYSPTGILEPLRVQGVLVETSEVEAIVNELKLTIDPDMINNLYDDNIINTKSSTAGSILENYNGDQEEEPEIIEKAIKIIRESKKGSTSLIQRKLGLGYARAAKILDILEEMGVVGPSNGSKPREVYE